MIDILNFSLYGIELLLLCFFSKRVFPWIASNAAQLLNMTLLFPQFLVFDRLVPCDFEIE